MKKYGMLAVAVLLISAHCISAQIETGDLDGDFRNTIPTAVPFLTIAPDSRASAMGDVGAATTPDVYSLHWNIGKYTFIERKGGFAISYTPWIRNLIPDVNLAYLSGYYKLNEKQTLSTSIRYFSLGNIVFTNITGTVTGQHNPNEFAADVGYSRLLTGHFSIGIAFRFIRSDLTGGQEVNGQRTNPGISFAGDLGLYYENTIYVGGNDAEWALGASLNNMGTPVSYTVDAEKTPIPSNLRLGGRFTYNINEYHSFSAHLDLNKLLVPTPPVMDMVHRDSTGEEVVIRGKESPNSVVMGMIQSFYDAPGAKMQNEKYSTFVEELHEIQYGFGIEYVGFDAFAVRSGYFHEHATKGNRRYITFGAGVRIKWIALDLSYLWPISPRSETPYSDTFRLSFSCEFGRDSQ